jgi:Porin subfamily
LYFHPQKAGPNIARLSSQLGMGQGMLTISKNPNPVLQFDWRSKMNIKSLLLGSAAAFAAVTGAQAADAIVAAEPEPMEYVRVCDAFGTGYFYIPGTETCLKIGGYVRFNVDFGRGIDNGWYASTKADLALTAKSSTDMGDLVSFMEFNQANGTKTVKGYADNAATGTFGIDSAYLSLGGFKAGYFADWFDDGINGEVDDLGSVKGARIQYTYEGPVTAGLALNQIASGKLGLQGKLGGKVDNFSAYLIGAYDWNVNSYAVGGVISVANLGPGTFQLGATYAEKANAYFGNNWGVAASYQLAATDALTFTPAVQYTKSFAAADNTDWKFGVLTEYKITDGLKGSLNVDYTTTSKQVGGWARLQRSF